jgi:prepilin-type N-terminal cleavage/methylation domain-containing protein
MNPAPLRAAGEGGFSLVELMVAMALSLAVVGGSLMIFTSHRRGFDRQQEIVNEQQIGRFALTTVADDIRQAGLWTRVSNPATVIDSTNNSGGAPNAIDGTDTLTLRYVAAMGNVTAVTVAPPTLTVVDRSPGSPGIDLDGDGGADLDAGDFQNGGVVRLAVSEGPYGKVVEEVDAIGLAGNLVTLRGPGLVNHYDAPVVGVVQVVQYTVDTPAGSPDMPSLYRERVRFDSAGNRISARQQLANFIDDFQVEFGSGIPDQSDLAAVGAADVRAIRVAVVTRSEEAVLPVDAAFPVTQDSARALGTDRYLRRVYEQTVALRN